jgi:HlyD family type I secretion membrane fusion protein
MSLETVTPYVPSAFAQPPRPRMRDDARRDILLGGCVAAAFFVGFLGWAAVAPLDSGAYATGVIAVSGNRQSVQHEGGGKVTALHVVEGQHVHKGDLLLEIGAADIQAAERGLTSEVLQLQAQRARLEAERDHASAVTTPVEYAALPAEDQALAADAMRLQQQQFQARRAALAAQQSVLGQREKQLGEQITGYDRQLDSNRQQQRLIGEELTGLRQLAAKGYAPTNRVRETERAAEGLVGEDGALQAQIAQGGQQIGETRMQMLSADRQMLQEVADQLRDTQSKLDEYVPKLRAAREQLADAMIRAPASGQVVGLSTFTVGGVVSPGEVLMDVVPDNKALVIQATVSPDDADDLSVGQDVQVRFSSLHERDLPILHAKVTKISADSFADEKTGRRYFRTEVSVPQEDLREINKVRGAARGLRPGLPAEVVIPLKKRTALSYLLEPLSQTFWKSFLEH